MYRPGKNELNDEPLLDESIRPIVTAQTQFTRSAANESEPRIQVSVRETSDVSDVVTESSSRDVQNVDHIRYPGWFFFNPLSTCMLTWQLSMVVLFTIATRFDDGYMPSTVVETSASKGSHYPMFQDSHVMMGVGFGFLYTLMRRYAWSGVGINYLLCASTFQWAILCNGFWNNIVHGTTIPLDLEALINADYVVATVLISFGALLGRLSPTQALWMSFIETIFCTANVALSVNLGISDAGGSMVIHIFGASFGLAFAFVLGDKASNRMHRVGNGEDALGTSKHNGTFAMIGTLVLFCSWPSFNAALLDGASVGRAVINTSLSIAASVTVAFAFSRAIHRSKFDMEHIQNATLAGGVAIGTACDMLLNPGLALLTGVCAGAVSTYCFSFLSPMLKRRGLTDACGIANLHLIPGLIGGLVGAGAAASVTGDVWPDAVIAVAFPGRRSRSAALQAGYQLVFTLSSMVWGGMSGALSALLLSRAACAEPMNASFYEDAGDWHVPEEEAEVFHTPRDTRT